MNLRKNIKYVILTALIVFGITLIGKQNTVKAATPTYVQYSPARYMDMKSNTVLYQNANTTSKRLITIPKKARTLGVGYQKYGSLTMIKTTYKGKTGYINSKTATWTFKNYVPDKIGIMKYATYMKSSIGGKNIYLVPKGFPVRVGGYYDTAGTNWFKIKYNNKIGYVSVASITCTNEKPKSVNYNPGRYIDITSNAILYGGYTPVSSNKAWVSKGTRLMCYSAKTYSFGNYLKVTYKGKTGYIVSKRAKWSYAGYSKAISGYTLANVYMKTAVGNNYGNRAYIPKNKTVTLYGYYRVAGYDWYKLGYGGKTGYVSSQYVSKLGSIDSRFPASYKIKLQALLKEHPSWSFVAINTGVSWNTLVNSERGTITKTNARQLVEADAPKSWKSTDPDAYNKSKGTYTYYDSKWNAASDAIIKYYLDPRNFMNDSYIYQFMHLGYDSSYQTLDSVKLAVTNSFMINGQYKDVYNSGVKNQMNPIALASMIIMEQGWNKGVATANLPKLISGTGAKSSDGKTLIGKGYYNYFNVGAYAAYNSTTKRTENATVNGLTRAKSEGWNSPEKAISGGVNYFVVNYLKKNQNTFYMKKFNVNNGASKMGSHEYSTYVAGGAQEGNLLGRMCSGLGNKPIKFYIPVYTNMPSSNPKPN
ncbi:MAG: hypothetical protein LBM02_07705 [Lachnospiraceae bacterium]|nr:hypothetical protein [Lachnospiraceae bacterium]